MWYVGEVARPYAVEEGEEKVSVCIGAEDCVVKVG